MKIELYNKTDEANVNSKEKLKILELFGGIGACSKALKNLGIDCEIVDYVEIDKYAVKSFNAIHNTNFEPQDICKWDKDIDVDLIMHGSPCQDFSTAGKQAGGDKDSGTRSSLMYETIRIVEKLKPKYVIWENVKNLLSKKHKHNFDAYIELMDNLGYISTYKVLNAKNFGVPQNRERVFTISIRKDLDNDFQMPEGHDCGIRLKDVLEKEVDKKYFLSEKQIERISNWNCYQKPLDNVKDLNSICSTLTARGAGEEHAGMVIVNRFGALTKLTPKECWRLMGFSDCDFENAEKVNSNAQLYKQAGNSIVVNVLMAIFGQLFNVEWEHLVFNFEKQEKEIENENI